MNRPSKTTCLNLINAIDTYIAKADNNLASDLKRRGYKKTKRSVEVADEIEDELTEEFHSDTMELISALKKYDKAEDFYEEGWTDYKDKHSKSGTIATLLGASMLGLVSTLSTEYIKESDPQLEVEQLSERTTSFIDEWSKSLGEKVKTDRLDQLESTLLKGLDDGSSVDKIAKELFDNEIREEYYQCKRIALTEVLRAHSMSQLEAIEQDPSVTHKVWRHTGGGMTSRLNHLDMDGQTVPKDKPFTLIGVDGVTYHPSMPHDPSLPAGESINCHCMLERVTDESILGLSLEEREALRDKAREEIGDEWKYELDSENKAKSGINEETIKLDWLKQKSKSGQIKYLGSKSRWALVESGVVTKDSQLFKTVNGVTRKKTLQELRESGIITVSNSTVNHSTLGNFKTLKDKAGNFTGEIRMKSGGHTIDNKIFLKKNGIEFNETVKFSNGVTLGSVSEHMITAKRTGNNQAWFPNTWDDEKVLLAGTTVANNNINKVADGVFVGEYDNVLVRVLVDEKGNVTTICPDYDQINIKGVEQIE